MQTDYTKLLFAAQVHSMAIEYFKTAKRAYLKDISGDDDLVDANLAEWSKSNNIDKYVAIAYKEIIGTAKQVESIIETERSAELNEALKDMISV